nr:MAG TPA: hypothetical protein [Caudoviricetes sp.]
MVGFSLILSNHRGRAIVYQIIRYSSHYVQAYRRFQQALSFFVG